MTEPDLVVRARRAWVDGTWRAAQVAVTDGRITALDGPVPAARARSSSSPTTRCCCPVSSTATCTSTSRAAPRGRASRRRPAPRRPVASRRSSTCRSTRSRPPRRSRRWAPSGRRRRQGERRRRVLGRGRAGQPRGRSVRCTRRASAGSRRSSAVGRRRVRAPRRRAAGDGAGGGRRARQRADRARRGPGRPGDARRAGAGYADFLASRPAVSERHAIARVIDGMRRRVPARTSCTCPTPARSTVPVREGRGAAADRRDVPALPRARAEDVPSAATQFKCCPPIRDAGNQDLLWGPCSTGRSTRSCPTTRPRPPT